MSSEAVDREVVMEDTQAWLTQAVIGLGLCPFANAVHTKHQINYSVCLSRNDSDVLVLLEREIHALQHTDPKLTQTTLIMAPFCVPEFLDFNALVKEALKLIKRLKVRDEFQLADFHPQYQFAGTHADDPENLTNCAPYPTLHLLRVSSVEEAVELFPDTESIYVRNKALLQSMGRETYEALGLRARLLPHQASTRGD